MARWDEILSLPVQNPPALEFSASELVWSKVEGWRDNIDRLALIPFARVDDFVRGESSNKDCPTRFHVEARRRRRPNAPLKQKVDGVLDYILYWCSFGPDDHRKGGVVRPSRNTYVPKKKKTAGRPNTKRGCTCHFMVKRLIAEPSVGLIIYNQDKHVDKKGLPCHGPQDKKAQGTRAMFAPYISEDLRLHVLSLLHVGVSVETIMQRHRELVEKQGGPSNRDDLLTHRYVRRQERNIRRSSYELDADEAVSVSLWVESHLSQVFFYEDFSDSEPFTLGLQTEWQLQHMIRFGNRSLLAFDSRFGTNKLKYPVQSLVVFNSDNKAIPVAWVIAPTFASADPHKWMRALYNRVRTKDPTWKLAAFVLDDPLIDPLTIRDVFQCTILISFWRVRHAWHKNLVKRCAETEMHVQIVKRLGEDVDALCRGHGRADSFEAFMEDCVDSSHFTEYFKAVWFPRMGFWETALKSLPMASLESCAAVEFYHNQLKVRLINEKDPCVYRRADWLVDKLGTKVHSYFWLDEYSEKGFFARYWKDEWVSGLTAWGKALKIPEQDVSLEERCVKVIDQIDPAIVHVVRNPGSQFALCNCSWAEMGNLCEHVIRVIRLYRDKGYCKPSVSLSQYKQALLDMLHCSPHDSLIRDYAISLAVAVQKQLDSLAGLNGSQSVMGRARIDSLEHQTMQSHFSGQEKNLVDQSQKMDEDIAPFADNDSGDRHKVPGSVSAHFGESNKGQNTCSNFPTSSQHHVVDKDAEECNNQTSNLNVSSDLFGHEQDSMMEVLPPYADFIPRVEFVVLNGQKNNDINGNEPSGTFDLNNGSSTAYNKCSCFAKDVESKVMDMAEAFCVTGGNDMMESDDENRSRTGAICSTDNVCSGNGINDVKMGDPNIDQGVDCVDEQLPVTNTSQRSSSSEKPSISGASNGDYDLISRHLDATDNPVN